MTIYSELAPLLRRFAPYLKEVRGRWLAAACLLVAGPALSACLLWSVKVLVDDVFVGRAFEQLPLLIGIYLAITVGKLAVSYAFIGVIASEFILAPSGLGRVISDAYTDFNNRQMYALMLLLIIVATVVNMLLHVVDQRWAERRGIAKP